MKFGDAEKGMSCSKLKPRATLNFQSMRMLRWMLDIRKVVKIRNEDIRVRARVINVREKM